MQVIETWRTGRATVLTLAADFCIRTTSATDFVAGGTTAGARQARSAVDEASCNNNQSDP